MIEMRDVGLVAAAYFIGAVPFAYIVVKLVAGVDIRTVGSGNVGATNVSRILGRKWGITVFMLDVLKGFVPVLIAQLAHERGIGGQGLPLGVALTGLAAIAGHNWPIYLRFRGGKGVATSAGVFLALFPLGLAIALAAWAVTVAVTRYISVGSMVGATALLGAAFLLRDEPLSADKWLTAFAGLAAVLSVVRHRSNIRRLMQGTESKVGSKKRAESA